MMKKREKSYTLNAKRRQKHYLNHIEECRENNRKR